MATMPQSSVDWRGSALRTAWERAGGYTSYTVSHVFRFFTTYPPLAQGLYYLLAGLWPLVGIAYYQEAMGHRHAPWLAQAVGVLLLVVGTTLCVAAWRRQGSPEVLVLAFGSALGLTAVDIHLVWRGYSSLYLLDAALQLGLVGFWAYGWHRARQTATAQATAAAINATPPPAASYSGSAS